jgi:hypothetical protein
METTSVYPPVNWQYINILFLRTPLLSVSVATCINLFILYSSPSYHPLQFPFIFNHIHSHSVPCFSYLHRSLLIFLHRFSCNSCPKTGHPNDFPLCFTLLLLSTSILHIVTCYGWVVWLITRRGFGLATGFIRYGDLQLLHRLHLQWTR